MRQEEVQNSIAYSYMFRTIASALQTAVMIHATVTCLHHHQHHQHYRTHDSKRCGRKLDGKCQHSATEPRSVPLFLALTSTADREKQMTRTMLLKLARPASDMPTSIVQPRSDDSLSLFSSVSTANLPVGDYIYRLMRYMDCSPSTFICAIVYCHRLAQKEPNLVINALNLHRLLTTAACIAIKFYEDVWFSNAYYALVGDIQKS